MQTIKKWLIDWFLPDIQDQEKRLTNFYFCAIIKTFIDLSTGIYDKKIIFWPFKSSWKIKLSIYFCIRLWCIFSPVISTREKEDREREVVKKKEEKENWMDKNRPLSHNQLWPVGEFENTFPPCCLACVSQVQWQHANRLILCRYYIE